MAQLAGFLFPQYFDNNGHPLSGGKIYAYAAGTSTPQDTYNSANGVFPNTNPIILSSSGRTKIFLQNLPYDFQIQNSAGVLIDSIQGVGSSANGGYSTVDSMFDLVNLPSGAYDYVEVGGWEGPGDGGGGLFYWDATSTTLIDGGIVFEPTSSPVSGRWIRIYSGPVNARWFDARGDGTNGDDYRIGLASSYVQSLTNGGTLFFPACVGGYYLLSNLAFGNKTHVEMEDGAFFSSAYSVTITFGAGFKKGANRAFSSSIGAVTFSAGSVPYALPQWWGATGLNVSDDSSYIQKALNYFPAVKILKGTYRIDATINLNSGNKLFGEGSDVSVLKVAAGVLVSNILKGDAINKAVVSRIGFDNYLNYPNDQTTSANEGYFLGDSFTFKVNTAIRFVNGCDKITVRDCYFYGITGCSIRFELSATPSSNIKILDNEFLYGSYVLAAIKIGGGTSGDTSRAESILVRGNILNYNSSQKYALPGISPRNASNDAIELYRCKKFVVSNNVVNYAASGGIRIERAVEGEVIGNVVTESGGTGITVYNSCQDIGVIGNTVKNWGRTPGYDNLRLYGGVYYLARETGVSGTVNLPANPAAPATGECTFVVNPYTLAGLDLTKVPAYSNLNYYDGAISFLSLPDGGVVTNPANFQTPSDQGILPFRGGAGIGVHQFSERIRVIGNSIVGNTTQAADVNQGGLLKYLYASDFGISAIHPVNNPQTYNMPFYETGNIITGCILAEVYVPAFVDPIARRGIITHPRKNSGNWKIGSVDSDLVPLAYDLIGQDQANQLQAKAIPALIFDGTNGYGKIRANSRPLLDVGTDAFGFFIYFKVTSAINTTTRWVWDAAAGGAATAGFAITIRSTRISFSVRNGVTTQSINYDGVTNWGASPNQVIKLYVTRDAAGTLRMIVNDASEVSSAVGAASGYDINTANGIGFGTVSDNTNNLIPMELYQAIMWKGQSFTRDQYFDRLNEKRIIRTGDSAILNLDMRTYGNFLKDQTDPSRIVYLSPSGFTCTHPYQETFAAWISNTNGNRYVTEGEGVAAGGKCVPDDFFITHVVMETTGTPTVKIGSSAGGAEILPSLVLTAGKTIVPINKATVNGTLNLSSTTTDTVKWFFFGFRASAFTLQASILRRGNPYVLNTNTTAVGNVLTGEDDLMSFSVPAALLAVDGDSIRMTAAGRFAATANNKTLKAYFGSDVLINTGALAITAASDWTLDVEVIRVSATTQKCRALFRCSDTTVTIACDYVAGTQTLSAANVLKLTGTGTATDDIVQEIMKTRFEPA